MCCKCCQYCLETIYWHCIEKHFCYDENIALYEEEEPKKEEPKSEEKNNNMYDNFAFYDNVAMIANRAIFCIEPLEKKPKAEPITQQPQRKITPEPKLKPPTIEIEEKPPALDPIIVPPVLEVKEKEEEEEIEEVEESVVDQKPPKPKIEFIIPTIREEFASNPNLTTIDSIHGSLPTICEEGPDNSLKPTTTHLSASTSNIPVKMRKKSLHERRVSKSLTLNIDKTAEVPIIRQNSFPKFYLDTPEKNQVDYSSLRTPVQALETPVLPNNKFNFDLRSVVQIENEKVKMANQQSVPKENRLSQIKDKLKPLKLLRSASSNSLQGYSGS